MSNCAFLEQQYINMQQVNKETRYQVDKNYNCYIKNASLYFLYHLISS